MDTIKKFGLYILLIATFWLFSNLLIKVAINIDYKPLERRDKLVAVEMKEAKATLINGKMSGTIKNSDKNFLTGKFLLVELFSKRDNLVGKKYIPINTTENINTQDFQFYFELKDVTSYCVSIVDKREGEEIKFIPKELSTTELFWGTLVILLLI